MADADPLPCPWCKETPAVGPDDWRAEGGAWGSVTCENPECLVQPSLKNWADVEASGEGGSLEQQRIAVGLWNEPLSAPGSSA